MGATNFPDCSKTFFGGATRTAGAAAGGGGGGGGGATRNVEANPFRSRLSVNYSPMKMGTMMIAELTARLIKACASVEPPLILLYSSIED